MVPGMCFPTYVTCLVGWRTSGNEKSKSPYTPLVMRKPPQGTLQNAISGISQSGPRYLTGEITLRVDISPQVRYLN